MDDETVIRMVGKGLGISMMSEMMIKGRTSGVKVLPISPVTARELGMGTDINARMTEGLAQLKSCVLDFTGGLQTDL